MILAPCSVIAAPSASALSIIAQPMQAYFPLVTALAPHPWQAAPSDSASIGMCLVV